ncbi:endoglucanase [Marininema mesophilum]|uniref:Endoglucanase n=1 Tax=Marininema mesophilum TaxID=1048340 RepID=A0A1H3CMK1_9BACL|nr:M42 family metallopeptidase [Marininema mesophilum]SDX55472.1 endoglucanase [Marininema mesophilum]
MVEGKAKKSTLQMSLEELTNVAGPPGNERETREVMERQLGPFVDEVLMDRLGSIIARLGHEGPRIMVAGHLDEVGFMVTRITKDGYLRFQALGGWWSPVITAQRVEVITKEKKILGVVGSKPPHLMTLEQRKKVTPLEELFIDIGATDEAEAESWGVQLGDVVVPYSPFTVMNNPKHWLAKAMDNRLGCAVAVEVLRRLKEKDHPNTVYGVGTVMEEVGRRGGFTATSVVKPDIGFAVDVGIASTPGCSKDEASSNMGDGPTLVLYDAGHIPHRGLIRLIQETAEGKGIPLQYEWISGGATDASRIHLHGEGVPTVSIGVPARYIHSHTSIIHEDDAERLVDLLVAVIERLDQKMVDQLADGTFL